MTSYKGQLIDMSYLFRGGVQRLIKELSVHLGEVSGDQRAGSYIYYRPPRYPEGNAESYTDVNIFYIC